MRQDLSKGAVATGDRARAEIKFHLLFPMTFRCSLIQGTHWLAGTLWLWVSWSQGPGLCGHVCLLHTQEGGTAQRTAPSLSAVLEGVWQSSPMQKLHSAHRVQA